MKSLFTFLLLFFATPVFAGDYKTEIKNFFKLYESGKKIEAVDALYSTNTWGASIQDSIQQIKSQFQNIEKLVGEYNGKEFLGEKSVKNRFVHVTYLVLYDRQPVRFEFQFYKPKADWIIYSFSFDTDIPDEVERMARRAIATGP